MAFNWNWFASCLAAASYLALVLFTHVVVAWQDQQPHLADQKPIFANRSMASATLAVALPNSVFFSPDQAFNESIQSYWGMQEREIVPECIVRPRNADEVAAAVRILKREYDTGAPRGEDHTPLQFAVRSGGHSPIPGAANAAGGVVIDLRLLNNVLPSEDGSSTVIGSGARWSDVSRVLDDKNLAVAGGRNSDVGVGGLTLGGGFSVFSWPGVGRTFSCSDKTRISEASSRQMYPASSSQPHHYRS